MKKGLFIVGIGFLIIAGFLWYFAAAPMAPVITNFDECAAAGNPIMESFPRKCMANGTTFTEVPCYLREDKIRVDAPLPNSQVLSPLKATGEARGCWYFEASFPVRLLDANGKELVAMPATAQGEWMTADFVPFEVTLEFDKPKTATGILRFERDNPSGLPEHDASVEIPVRF